MEKNDFSSINEKLRKERLERGWSQQYVADQLGTAVVTYNRWERGRQQPTAYYSLKLGTLFGKSAEELGLVEEKEPSLSADGVQQKTSTIKIEPSITEEAKLHGIIQPASLPFDILSRHTLSSEQAPKVPSYFDLPKRGRILFPIVLFVFLVMGVLAVLFLRYPFVPSSSSTANIQQYPSPPADLAKIKKKLIFDDPMSNQRENSQWATGNNCQFKQGAYQIASVGVNYCLASVQTFSNMVYQIEMVLQQGTKAGIVFRADDNSNLYYADINAKGQYEMGVELPPPSSMKILLHGNSSAIITGDNHSNVLTVEANNKQLTLWINGSIIGHVQDTAYANGYIGVFVGDYNNASDPTQTRAIFRNTQVWLVS